MASATVSAIEASSVSPRAAVACNLRKSDLLRRALSWSSVSTSLAKRVSTSSLGLAVCLASTRQLRATEFTSKFCWVMGLL